MTNDDTRQPVRWTPRARRIGSALQYLACAGVAYALIVAANVTADVLAYVR